MSTAAQSHMYTPEDLEEMEDGVAYELEDGELVERPVGLKSSIIGSKINAILVNFTQEHDLGFVAGSDLGLKIWPDRPRNFKRPDVAFVQWARYPAADVAEGELTIPPDLVVEVISPHDKAEAVQRKVREYLAAGVRLVWIVFPETQTAEVYRLDGTSTPVAPEGFLDGEDVMPGLRIPMPGIFALRPQRP
ncbi:MAG: Uma2 family endonuclease [Chloroflexi bacterium]|nr:Uma2 family endonuclease [Chloroflexota bacterium]